jgi:hypothetical protein
MRHPLFSVSVLPLLYRIYKIMQYGVEKFSGGYSEYRICKSVNFPCVSLSNMLK